jgi:hypothetical protein
VNKQNTRVCRHQLESSGSHPKRFFPRKIFLERGKAPLVGTVERFVDHLTRGFTPELAKHFAELPMPDPEFQARLDELAAKANKGTLTDEPLGMPWRISSIGSSSNRRFLPPRSPSSSANRSIAGPSRGLTGSDRLG